LDISTSYWFNYLLIYLLKLNNKKGIKCPNNSPVPQFWCISACRWPFCCHGLWQRNYHQPATFRRVRFLHRTIKQLIN